MTSYTCSVRVHLPRPLFRKLMAQAILERTDLSALVIRAIRAEAPPVIRRRRRVPPASKSGSGSA